MIIILMKQCVAYHATNLKFVQSILETKLQPGTEQWHEKEDDLNHPGQKVGIGVYCSPDIKELKVMEEFQLMV